MIFMVKIKIIGVLSLMVTYRSFVACVKGKIPKLMLLSFVVC